MNEGRGVKLKAKCQKERQLNANLKLSGIAHLPSFICWADQSWKKIIAIFKFYPFSTMDPSLKSQYQRLSQHCKNKHAQLPACKISLLKQPIRIPTSQMALTMLKIYILGWQKGYEEASKIGITGIAAKVAKDPDGYCKLQSHVPEQNTFIGKQFYSVSGPLVKKKHNVLGPPGLEPNFKEDPDGFMCHLSFTISKFANKPHKDNYASPFTFFMWIPIKQTNGNLVEENFEVKGGEFFFPDDSYGINFSGFNGIVECA
ncbi:hypothetical protein VP01_970g3 [Puccinia sorghi]|uniref:Tet-like 2OG-Fe(II) oxygenase domain-containing protein n=1 Tax=Puccinia sorghi TaxID=27349 RepID=A0A0L6U829_9BASI|nr:hypothetical protein VP01_970g3 [Puccinia sorghi]